MSQPLSVKTVIVPKGQNKYGCDVVRFTADYAASDLFEACIGCYPLPQNNLTQVVIDSPYSDLPRVTVDDAYRKIDLRQAYNGICDAGDPSVKPGSLLDKLGTSASGGAQVPHYWDV